MPQNCWLTRVEALALSKKKKLQQTLHRVIGGAINWLKLGYYRKLMYSNKFTTI